MVNCVPKYPLDVGEAFILGVFNAKHPTKNESSNLYLEFWHKILEMILKGVFRGITTKKPSVTPFWGRLHVYPKVPPT